MIFHIDQRSGYLTIAINGNSQHEKVQALSQLLKQHSFAHNSMFNGQQTVFSLLKQNFDDQDFQKDFTWMALSL